MKYNDKPKLRAIFNEVTAMQITLSSGKYNIVDSGQVFLFGEDEDLRIEVNTDKDFTFSMVFKFAKDNSGENKIVKKVVENTMEFLCLNFQDLGTGFSEPMSIAKIEGKEMFLMLWSCIEGEKEGAGVRSVKYTIYMEK